jgi:hypothetical protein
MPYTGTMMLRRLGLLIAMSAYLSAGLCRQACAVDQGTRAGAMTLTASGTGHDCCRGKSADPARRPHDRCIARMHDGSVLLPRQAVLASVSSRTIAFVAANPLPAADASAVSVSLEPRAPPGPEPAVLSDVLHGPRPPPSLPAVR